MIYQDDSRFKIYPVEEAGCFLLSVYWYIALLTDEEFTPSIIERDLCDMTAIYEATHEPPPVSRKCYINNYDQIAKYYGIRARAPARHAKPYEPWYWNQQALIVLRNGDMLHATAAASMYITAYDPKRFIRFDESWEIDSMRILSWDRR